MRKPSNPVADEIRRTLESVNESDRNCEPANVVDGLFAIARALDRVAKALVRLGNNEAATPMGALEMLALEVKNGTDAIAASIGAGFTELAEAIPSEKDSE